MLEFIPLPAFQDNYLWLIKQPDSHFCTLVDPGDAEVVIAYLQMHELELADILITHHHPDHTGGLTQLMKAFPEAHVYAPAHHHLPKGLNFVVDKQTIFVESLGAEFTVIATPGHTLDHVCYYTPGHLLAGDTLFAGGCGRLFEGTPDQMYESLSKLAQLPPDTKIYCAHEYTQSNLEFALSIEPENTALVNRLAKVTLQRENHEITLPSTLLIEMQTNPFLRCDSLDFRERVSKTIGQACISAVRTFALIRQRKDQW